jgi:hypothetical protein
MKKGISQVIASVFLIGLTVTLAIIIFTWSSIYVGNLSPPSEILCEGVSFEAGIYSADDNTETPTQILEINNNGNVDISKLLAKVKNPTIASVEIIQIDISIISSYSKKTSINFNSNYETLIVPIIMVDNKEIICPDYLGVLV